MGKSLTLEVLLMIETLTVEVDSGMLSTGPAIFGRSPTDLESLKIFSLLRLVYFHELSLDLLGSAAR